MKIPMELWNAIEVHYKNNQFRATPLASIDDGMPINIQYWKLEIKQTIFGPDNRTIMFLDKEAAQSYIMRNFVIKYSLTQS